MQGIKIVKNIPKGLPGFTANEWFPIDGPTSKASPPSGVCLQSDLLLHVPYAISCLLVILPSILVQLPGLQQNRSMRWWCHPPSGCAQDRNAAVCLLIDMQVVVTAIIAAIVSLLDASAIGTNFAAVNGYDLEPKKARFGSSRFRF